MNITQENAVDFPASVEPIHYEEAIRRIHTMRGLCSEARQKSKMREECLVPVRAFELLLAAEVIALKFLNDERFNYAVPWDWELCLPSIPSMIADVRVFAARSSAREEPDRFIRAVLVSFAETVSMFREKRTCGCGGHAMVERDVDITLILRHLAEKRGNRLLLSQIVGAVSKDRDHLLHHYHGHVSAPELEKGVGVWRSETTLEFTRGSVAIAECREQCKKEFQGAKFAEFFLKKIQKI